jgi:hypothetical protein
MGHDGMPEYRGLELLGGRLPAQTEAWPKFETRRKLDASGDFYDISREELREYAEAKLWVWPRRTIFFLCDQHADADAFFRSLLATGGVAKTGPQDGDFELTPEGREAVFVLGGDCLDKGPNNLRLLRAIRLLVDRGAEVDILAGNHDVRALVGLEYMGRKEPWLAHLFIRMGKKSIPLFKEIHDTYGSAGGADIPDEAQLRDFFFPDVSWFEAFPRAVMGFLSEKKIQREVVRIREKIEEFETRRQELGLSLGDIYAAARQARGLFVDPKGDFHWFFARMRLARREGSFLFIHAGVDDFIAGQIRGDGVDRLNERFRELVQGDLFELYHGPVGNAFRTKYRDSDLPLTTQGVQDMRLAGIHAIVHGHRCIPRGQRLVLRNGLLNVECDATVDCNSRRLLELEGVGGAATILRTDGTLIAISTDYPYVKALDARGLTASMTVQ